MTALLMGVGWKILAGFGAVLALVLAWLTTLWRAKEEGVAKQQTAELKQRESDLEKAHEAGGSVNTLDDDAAIAELHRDYDRKPVRLGEDNHRSS